MMQLNWLCFLVLIIGVVVGYPYMYETKNFKVGIEYDHSLPMYGGSDRFRHRNNYDPFFVTVSATAKLQDLGIVKFKAAKGQQLLPYANFNNCTQDVNYEQVTVQPDVRMDGHSKCFVYYQTSDPSWLRTGAMYNVFKNGFVISYMEVSATVDAAGEVDFRMIRGETGAKIMTFQLVSNNSDFLSYNYLAYGIREAEYRKVMQVSEPHY